MLILEGVQDTIQRIFFNRRPELLVKKSSKAIGARALGRPETTKGLNYLNFRSGRAEIKIIFSKDGRENKSSNSFAIGGLEEDKRFEK